MKKNEINKLLKSENVYRFSTPGIDGVVYSKDKYVVVSTYAGLKMTVSSFTSLSNASWGLKYELQNGAMDAVIYEIKEYLYTEKDYLKYRE